MESEGNGLIVTRKIGESVIINKNVKVTIVSTKGDYVRLSIKAPKKVPIDREEVHLKKRGVK